MDIYYSEWETGNNTAISNYAKGELQQVLTEFHLRNLPDKPESCLWGFFCLHPRGEQINLGIGEKPCGKASLIIYPTKKTCQANLAECLAEGNEPKIDSGDLKS